MLSLLFIAIVLVAAHWQMVPADWTPSQIKKFLLNSPTHAAALTGKPGIASSDPSPWNQTGTAYSKQQALWNRIVADNNVGASWPGTLELLGLFTETTA